MISVNDINRQPNKYLDQQVSITGLVVCIEDPFKCYMVHSIRELESPVDKSKGIYIKITHNKLAELFYENGNARCGGPYGFSHIAQIQGLLSYNDGVYELSKIVAITIETKEGEKKLV